MFKALFTKLFPKKQNEVEQINVNPAFTEPIPTEFEKRRAFQLFNDLITPESIEQMADEIYVFSDKSETLERIDKLGLIFQDPTTRDFSGDTYSDLRREALKHRDVNFFRMTGQEQKEFCSDRGFGEKLDIVLKKKSPAFKVVK